MSKEKKMPKLRFPEFKESWDNNIIGDITQRYVNPVDVNPDTYYREIGIRSHGKGLFHKEPVLGRELGNKRVFRIKENALIVNIVFAWEQAIGKTTEKEIDMIASHRFPMYMPKDNKSSVDFLLHFFLTTKGKYLLESASPGGAGRNKTLGQKEFDNVSLATPSLPEQQKIADFLNLIDGHIKLLKEKKEALESYKKGVMQKIFSQEIRLKDENGNDFPEWEIERLGDMLDYEQPTKYIVKSTEYNSGFSIPVLTAGKSFILGYTNENFDIYENVPVIIFDDFTTSSQFVTFPFKVKSSAMKLLKAKNNYDIRFLYEAMQMIKFEVGSHGRHWISVFEKMELLIPKMPEQKKIANLLSAIDKKISICETQITESEIYKKGLLQQMFV